MEELLVKFEKVAGGPKGLHKVHIACPLFETGRKIPWMTNSEEARQRHLAVTGGRLRFRFPPEPNGHLHIGHAKSMAINFGSARNSGGTCYLRFDDTNPEAENSEFTDAIRENVAWLGWKPDKTTYSSDYFDQLYEFAEQLTRQGDAYVDASNIDEIRSQRHDLRASPYRDRPSGESIELFREMRAGLHPAGTLTLRLRCGDDGYRNDNPNLRDPVAYRIKFASHHRTGDKWCIYPSYDFTHCICDALEDIDYSICTLEFETRREPYYWILDRLGLWKPHVFEFSRLNIEGAVLSKRAINALIMGGKLDGYGDARLLTLAGMRRRGYPPRVINEFCRDLGVSQVNNTVSMHLLTHYLRRDLDQNARRVFGVLSPLRVVLSNYREGVDPDAFEAPNHPAKPDFGVRTLPFGREVWIDRSDFRLDNPPKYWRLAPGKTVGLRYGPNITCDGYELDGDGNVETLHCSVDFEKRVKPKAHIHWVAAPYRIIDVYLYPDGLMDGDIQRRVLTRGAYLEGGALDLDECDEIGVLQFERTGYFAYDRDASVDRPVFHETVELKADVNQGKREPKGI